MLQIHLYYFYSILISRHGITSRKSDIIPIQTQSKRCLTLRQRQERISLTFRKSILDPCTCPYVKHCPSQSKDKVEEMSNDTASKLEKLHVHEVYEKIADHFSETRYVFETNFVPKLLTKN